MSQDVKETLRQLIEVADAQDLSDDDTLQFVADACETIKREIDAARRQRRAGKRIEAPASPLH